MHQNASSVLLSCRLPGGSSCRQIKFYTTCNWCALRAVAVVHISIYCVTLSSPHIWFSFFFLLQRRRQRWRPKGERYFICCQAHPQWPHSLRLRRRLHNCNCSRHTYIGCACYEFGELSFWMISAFKLGHRSKKCSTATTVSIALCIRSFRTTYRTYVRSSWLHSSYFSPVPWTASAKNNYARLIAVWARRIIKCTRS